MFLYVLQDKSTWNAHQGQETLRRVSTQSERAPEWYAPGPAMHYSLSDRERRRVAKRKDLQSFGVSLKNGA